MWSTATGEGRDILFIHGWTLDQRDERRTYEPIFRQRSGWRRHYLDLPGMGQSPAQAGIADMDGMLEAVVEFIGSHLGQRRFLVAGTSAGGYLARGVVHRLGSLIDGVLLRAPLIVPPDAKRDIDPIKPVIADASVLASLSENERTELGEVLVQTPAYLEALRRKRREVIAPAQAIADSGFLEPIRQDPARYAFSFDVDAAMAPFAGPSLIVTGRHDSNVGYRDAWRLLGKFQRATFVVLDRAEHGLPVDQQALFVSLVHDWLDRVEQTPGRGVAHEHPRGAEFDN